MPYFQLPSLSFRRRRKSDVDLETLFIHPEKKEAAAAAMERFAGTSAEENADVRENQEKTAPEQKNEYQRDRFSAERPAGTRYEQQESESRSPAGERRFFQSAVRKEQSFSGPGMETAADKFPAEPPLRPQENTMPEQKSAVLLSAAIGALTECARGQLRYLKKNYDLLKTQSEDRYFN